MGELPSAGHFSLTGRLTGLAASDLTFAGHAALANASASGTSGINFADLDVSDPDSLYAFFSAQMTQAKGEVASLMQGQDARNKKIQHLQSINSTLQQWEEAPPTDEKGKAALTQALQEALAELPKDSTEWKAISALVPTAAPEKEVTQDFVTMSSDLRGNAKMTISPDMDATAFAAGVHGTVEKRTGANGTPIFTVHYTPGGPTAALTKDQIKSIEANIKSATDGLASENTMNMIRIQQGVERMSQITNLCSNVLKKQSDAQDSVITNLR